MNHEEVASLQLREDVSPDQKTWWRKRAKEVASEGVAQVDIVDHVTSPGQKTPWWKRKKKASGEGEAHVIVEDGQQSPRWKPMKETVARGYAEAGYGKNGTTPISV